MELLAFIAILWGLFVTILWLVIGWRAMRAHEKIADQLFVLAVKESREEFTSSAALSQQKGHLTEQHRLYRRFLAANPHAEQMDAKHRHELFLEWLSERGENFQE